jgi:hypothetical protein
MDVSYHLNGILSSAVERLLRPLVRILIARGFAFSAFVEVAKRAYAEAAVRDVARVGKLAAISRASTLTGLSRREVLHALRDSVTLEVDTGERFSRAARVIAAWIRDPNFTDSFGEPRPLAFEDNPTEFGELVRRYCGDVPMRVVYDELVRVGAVARLPDERVRLVARAYVPTRSEVDKIGILGSDVADFIRTIEHNLEPGVTEPLFQRKVVYDNLPHEALSRFRELSTLHAQQLLERMDLWLAANDRDFNPTVKGSGRSRAGIAVYYFEETLEPAPESPEQI